MYECLRVCMHLTPIDLYIYWRFQFEISTNIACLTIELFWGAVRNLASLLILSARTLNNRNFDDHVMSIECVCVYSKHPCFEINSIHEIRWFVASSIQIDISVKWCSMTTMSSYTYARKYAFDFPVEVPARPLDWQ